jgi:AraC-like DNA-binding protein
LSIQQPQVILNTQFSEVGPFSQRIGWDTDFRQLETGQLKAGGTVVTNPTSSILRVDFNRALHQVGEAPRDKLTFGIALTEGDQLDWCGTSITGCSLLNFNLEQGFDAVSSSRFSGYTLSFDKEAVFKLAATMGLCGSIDTLLQRDQTWQSAEIHSAQKHLNAIFSKVRSGDPTLMYENHEFLSQGIIALIIEHLCGSASFRKTEPLSFRNTALKRALEILGDPENLPITIAELCYRVEASPATLQRAFQSRFNMNTKSYIRARCLSAVRDNLATANPGIPIYKVANHWGFWHMGQFAKDFRQMFGYLPSDVIR